MLGGGLVRAEPPPDGGTRIGRLPSQGRGTMKRLVLVTAGAAGIGRKIARAFAADGADVFVCDIDAEGLDCLAQEISTVRTTVCDVADRQSIEHMVAAGVDALGDLDVLVNNTGISGPTAPVEEVDPDEGTGSCWWT
jgi:NAD(P)-dependent dehydrogenase (short-subunit alcohol dehydrogenase family)